MAESDVSGSPGSIEYQVIGVPILSLSANWRLSILLPLLATLPFRNAVATPPDELITLTGVIDQTMVSYFDSMVTSATRKVRITSPGGHIAFALDLADRISRRRLEVEAFKLCASSCAHYVFVSGASRTVAPDTLVLFHNTARSMAILYQRINRRGPVGWFDEWVGLLPREAKLYQNMGVSQDLLIDPEVVLEPVCIGFGFPAGRRTTWRLYRKSSVWVPSEKYLKSKGVDFSGYWPSSLADVQLLVANYSKADAKTVRYGEAGLVNGDGSSAEAFSAFGLCGVG